MASVPKPSLENDPKGTASRQGSPEELASAVLTPPPLDSSPPPSDAPTLIDQPYDSPTVLELPKTPQTPVALTDATVVDIGKRQSQSTHISGGQPVLLPGTLLAGRYEITALLGEGGMGAVYKTHDRELNRPVALKVIRPDLGRNESIIDRFKQE